MTVSTVPSSDPEFAGVGFVLAPVARNALMKTDFLDRRIASLTLLTTAGQFNILNTYVPQNARPEEERRAHFDQLHTHLEKSNVKGVLL